MRVNSVSSNFESHVLSAARRFVRTAVVIDDDIEAPALDLGKKSQPTTIVAPKPRFGASSAAKTLTGSPTEARAQPLEQARKRADASEVALKPLADAFLDRQIVCGVLKPMKDDKKDDIIKRAVEAAAIADVLIIDWYLRAGDASFAKSILATVLERDKELQGRLRLVIVYTSAAPLAERRKDLKDALEERGFKVRASADEMALQVDTCRIRFVEKAFANVGVGVADLPDLAIREFAQQAQGLLSAFTLSGIAALREATHHLLATFGKKFDPAFVGHRMLISDPEDAYGFAMNVLMLQIRGVLSLPHLLGSSLRDDQITDWFDARFGYDDAEGELKKLNVNKDDLRATVLAGSYKGAAMHTALFLPGSSGKATAVEKDVSADFARLTTFVREYRGFNPLPKDWLPTLTLGSVVRKRTPKSGARYFLCIQPACDTVRIDEPRYFPFVELSKETQKSDSWLIVQDGKTRQVLRVDGKAGARHYDRFVPDETSKTVRAVEKFRAGKSTGFFFVNEDDVGYQWMGDVDGAKAQKIAVDLAAGLARVGLDEYEWLRRGAKAK